MFYYFLPKSTGLPIYSHRLSIVAFWSLVFAYLWTGAHHLVYTPLPDWIQTLGIVFTIFLIAPSWGSVVNGYYTIGADWSKMKTELPRPSSSSWASPSTACRRCRDRPRACGWFASSSTTPTGSPATCTWAPWAG